MKKLYMAIDQYGQTYHSLINPRKELSEIIGNKHVEKLYQDDVHGNTFHMGYVIGSLWLTLYEVTPYRGK